LFDQESKRRVSSLLQEAGFDLFATEAEAYRRCADDLEKANRMLKAAQDGRDKALRMIAKYRRSLADQLLQNSNRVLAANGGSQHRPMMLEIEHGTRTADCGQPTQCEEKHRAEIGLLRASCSGCAHIRSSRYSPRDDL
jgi:hypothetical protein